MRARSKTIGRSKYKSLILVLLLPMILVWGHALATTLNLSGSRARTAYGGVLANVFSNGFDLSSAKVVLDNVADTAVITITTFGRNGSGDPDPDVIGAGCPAGGANCVTGTIAGCPEKAILLADTNPN
ncbi:MAG TPA: hypothetical protein VFF86_04825, partial [Candidatus Methylomirabilis sp.]|nr:hypothetical protein [Candidatus Methylomirabilis sp.]